jgi:hypothetical protein
MHIALARHLALLYVSSFLLITEYYEDSFGCLDFHTQELLPYHVIELIDEPSTEDCEVWMIHVDYIKCESFCSSVIKISKRYWKSYLSRWLDWLSSEVQ